MSGRKINVKMPLGKAERIVVKHRPIWIDDIGESGDTVIESTICSICGKAWGLHD